jgi:aspartate/methionine/tyrosine aminotransferase
MPCNTLTDYEINALAHEVNLADGHAYQEMIVPFAGIVENLDTIWAACERMRIPDMEHQFRAAFATLAGSPFMAKLPTFKICPTASISIDIIAAALQQQRRRTRLVEPTFDNLALIMRRRGVYLEAIRESDLLRAAAQGALPSVLKDHSCGALFIVQPNNPTGSTLGKTDFTAIANYCASRDIILVIDNSFRFYNREPFDDYEILAESGVSFMALEDTGKVWPVHDLKASLLFCSNDIYPLLTSIYNELFLCTSRFGLGLLEQYILRTHSFGLSRTIWPQLDHRRSLLRGSISGTGLAVDPDSTCSQISVEWMQLQEYWLNDVQATQYLADLGLLILPGRYFYWRSGDKIEHQRNVRLALMKPLSSLHQAINILQSQALTSARGRSARL